MTESKNYNIVHKNWKLYKDVERTVQRKGSWKSAKDYNYKPTGKAVNHI